PHSFQLEADKQKLSAAKDVNSKFELLSLEVHRLIHYSLAPDGRIGWISKEHIEKIRSYEQTRDEAVSSFVKCLVANQSFISERITTELTEYLKLFTDLMNSFAVLSLEPPSYKRYLDFCADTSRLTVMVTEQETRVRGELSAAAGGFCSAPA
ncbi:MAG: hypothetical protein WA738_15245, partial [Candidatus Angelobacter sp.]